MWGPGNRKRRLRKMRASSVMITGSFRFINNISPKRSYLILLHPIGNKNVRLALHLRVAVRGEDQPVAVGREHGEAVEGVVVCDALQIRAVNVDRVKIE